jgi:PAS domain S-box-containing protein
MLKTGKVEAEARGIRKDGAIFYKQLTMVCAYNEQGEFIGHHCFMKDVSERKQTELENQRLKERMQFILSSSPAIIYTCQPSSDFGATFVSDNIQYILGYTTAEFIKESNFWANHIHPEDIAGVFANIAILLEQGHNDYEYRFRHKNGNYLWMRDEQRIVRNREGIIIEIVGYFADISERKRLEQEQNRLIAILEASTDYIGMTDAAGNILWNNREFRRLLGLDSNASVKEKLIPDYHPQWALKLVLEEGLPGAIANGTWVGETALLNAQGEEIPVSQLIIAHKSPQGEVEFFSTILRDIRIRKKYELQLERSNAELHRATRLKNEFLANMSHELRTPLNAILGLSEGLQDEVFGVLNERQKKSLSTIERSGRHLLELINDILDVSKIEAGKVELDMTSISVLQLCNTSLAFVKQQAMQKNIQLKTVFQDDLGEIIVDERRMRQVFINLLMNAVKFTPAGGQVILDVHLESLEVCQVDEGCSPSQPNFLYSLCFSIIDTGIGIAATDIDKLFQPFIQIDSSLNRKYAGTGLGLTLVKQLLELHGATITVNSELGQGSCFTVRLPYIPKGTVRPTLQTSLVSSALPLAATIEKLQRTDDTQTPEPVIKQPVILLAEDNVANIETFCAYLGAYGYQLILANNGHQAIALATTQIPNLILMDIQMPEMDGLEAICQIRANPQLVSIPIIALTALAMPGDQEKCLQAGANEYLSKPVKLKRLAEVIQKLLMGIT